MESIRFNIDKAIGYMNRSLELSRHINEKRGERLALGNLGSCYAILGENKKAEELLLEGLKISRSLNDTKGIAVMLDTLSKLYLEMGRRQEAEESAEEAFKKVSPENDINEHARLFIIRERITAVKNKNEAVKNLEKYLELATDEGPKGMLLTELYFITGESSLKEKAVLMLRGAYEKTSETQYLKFIKCLEENNRIYQV
ncbi:MAG: tetratricopeptide repeat protein [bacterium]